MNFSKNPQKQQHHSEKFQKSSIIFTQLGLVLALLIVYLALEFTTEKKVAILDLFTPDDETFFMASDIDAIIIKKKKTITEIETPPKIKKLAPLTDIKKVPDDTNLPEQVLGPPDETPINKVIDGIIEVTQDPTEPVGKIDFIVVEDVPVYPGCEGLNNKEAKKCFTKKVSKFVNKKFNPAVAEGINTSGKQRIFVKFTIDKNGEAVDIMANSPFKQLEKEAIRVIQKLPQMTPGMQRKRPVAVKYTLPIVFFIE